MLLVSYIHTFVKYLHISIIRRPNLLGNREERAGDPFCSYLLEATGRPQGDPAASHPAQRGLRCASREPPPSALTLCQTPSRGGHQPPPAPTTPRVRAPRIVYAKGVPAHVRRGHMRPAVAKGKSQAEISWTNQSNLARFVVHVTTQPLSVAATWGPHVRLKV